MHRSIGDSGNRTSRHSDTGRMDVNAIQQVRVSSRQFLSASSGNTPQVRESAIQRATSKPSSIRRHQRKFGGSRKSASLRSNDKLHKIASHTSHFAQEEQLCWDIRDTARHDTIEYIHIANRAKYSNIH